MTTIAEPSDWPVKNGKPGSYPETGLGEITSRKSACGTCHFGLEFSTADLAPGMTGIPQITKASRVAGDVPAE